MSRQGGTEKGERMHCGECDVHPNGREGDGPAYAVRTMAETLAERKGVLSRWRHHPLL